MIKHLNITSCPCGRRVVVLSYGMGVDSTAILLRWLIDAASRVVEGEAFDLCDLIVLTAQTGDEFLSTGSLVDAHILPRLAAAGVRFVEVSRAWEPGQIVVLQDTRNPTGLHVRPTLDHNYFRLSDELMRAGTIPTSGGVHMCSIHSKAEPLDKWINANVGSHAHAMGFNADETGRASRDTAARGPSIAFGYNADEGKRAVNATAYRDSTKQEVGAFYPLIEWGWDYQDCIDYIATHTGVARWPKSACGYCPFSGGRKLVMDRYRAEPDSAAFALVLETMALAINPRMKLFVTKTLRSLLLDDGNTEALKLADAMLDRAEWAVYDVRRIFSGPGKAQRDIRIVKRGTRSEIESEMITVIEKNNSVDVIEEPKVDRNGSPLINPKTGKQKISKRYAYPVIEQLLCTGPSFAVDKGPKNFDDRWVEEEATYHLVHNL